MVSCTKGSKPVAELDKSIVYQSKDKEIVQAIFDKFSGEKNQPAGDLVVLVGRFLLETPYVGQTLESDSERLVINLRQLDCTTFAENCLALTRTLKSEDISFNHFAGELKNMRYHQGKIDGYPSRIHYFSDWIYSNNLANLVRDISFEVGQVQYPLSVNFMSTHPGSYRQLSGHPELIPIIAEQEKTISSRAMYYIPKEAVAGIESQLRDGDIAGITTNVKGLDISHVVILIRVDGRIHLLHASSDARKVVISEKTLEDYLKGSKSATGIMVARPV
jgi:hypothetical protein